MSGYPMRRVASVLTLTLAVAGAACTSQSITDQGGGASALTAYQADSLAASVATDVNELAEASAFDASTGMDLASRPGHVAGQAVPPRPPCIVVSPTDPPTDMDGDMVPDSARFDFSACTYTRGSFTFAVTGKVDIIDPAPTTPSLGVKSVFIGFGRSVTNTSTNQTLSAVHDGTRQWTATADQLTHTIGLTGIPFSTVLTFPNGQTASHAKNWSSIFTADVQGSIMFGSPLPAGNWSLNGTSTWTKGARSWSATVTTQTPLHFNPGCSLAPRFDSGQLVLVVTRMGQTFNVTITFTGCGAVTVVRTPVV